MKIAIMGATGFIGSHLIEKLVCVGAAVTAVAPDLGWRPIVRHLTNQGRVHFIQLREFWNRAALERVAPAALRPRAFGRALPLRRLHRAAGVQVRAGDLPAA